MIQTLKKLSFAVVSLQSLRPAVLTLIIALVTMPQLSQAHCQIPCGIYDDHARVKAMLEDVITIEKSVKLITELSGKTDAQSQNQLVRWVMNKETHADNIITTMGNYFLTQRVKPKHKDYQQQLAKHHAVIVSAMKAKQNVDKDAVKTLKIAVEALFKYYPEHQH